MRSVLTIIFKTVLGGVLGALTFISLGSIKGLFDGLILIHKSLAYTPVGILFLGPWYASWLGGDLVLLSAFIGSEIAFLKNFRKVVFGRFSIETAKKAFGAAFFALSVVTAFCIYIKIQRLIQIESTHSRFCTSILGEDYPSAYKYFSPEYRSGTDLDQFIEDEWWFVSPYLQSCYTSRRSGTFVSSVGNAASILPYESYQSALMTSFAMFPDGPELFMENINGEWYFTGEAYLPYTCRCEPGSSLLDALAISLSIFFLCPSFGFLLVLLFAVFRYFYREKYAEGIFRLPDAKRDRLVKSDKTLVELFRIILWFSPSYLIFVPFALYYAGNTFLDHARDTSLVATVCMVLLVVTILQEYLFRKWLISYLETKEFPK